MTMRHQKKCSTATLAALTVIWGLMLATQGETASAQTMKAPAPPQASTKSQNSDVFVPDAPDKHVVVKGDTLWGIASKYLKSPWRWPEVWRMNRQQIKNPHWIYPGQVILLDKSAGTMSIQGSGPGGTVTLEPTIRIEQGKGAIPSIPQDVIEPFLVKPILVENDQLEAAPRVVASKGDRIAMVRGDTIYVAGIKEANSDTFNIYRPGRPVKDPETGDLLGYQADYVGSAKVVKAGDPATAVITSFSEEISVGDRLVEATRPELVNYAPHSPEQMVKGHVIMTYDDVGLAGREMVVVLNRGSADGLDIGAVLVASTAGRKIVDTTNGSRETIQLPDENAGLMFVFRVFDHVSYALVLNSEPGIEAGDAFASP